MTDLVHILPSFPLARFAALIPAIEYQGITTTDLLTLHPTDLAKQTRLPLLDLRRLIATIQVALSDDLTPQLLLVDDPPEQKVPGPNEAGPPDSHDDDAGPAITTEPETEPVVNADPKPEPQQTPVAPPPAPGVISTLDRDLDAALGGGLPVGAVSEFAGESGVGKTQALLGLCLAVQLPPPHGLGRHALYISTEAPMATRRLTQMLAANPVLRAVEPEHRPSLDRIHSAVTPDLETQDHILEFQVPVLLSRYDIGLVVLDSVAANYRAEFERDGSRGSNMAARSAELVRLGALLRDWARQKNLAVVVANQVADRFAPVPSPQAATAPRSSGFVPESPLASRSMPPPPSSNFSATPSSSMPLPFHGPDGPPPPPALMLDHQQRWLTGWGDDPYTSKALKSPSLGLVWVTQIACRIALSKRPVYGRTRQAAPLSAGDDYDYMEPTLKAWRRWMKVVFAPHTAASGQGVKNAVEYEITAGGLKAVEGRRKTSKKAT